MDLNDLKNYNFKLGLANYSGQKNISRMICFNFITLYGFGI